MANLHLAGPKGPALHYRPKGPALHFRPALPRQCQTEHAERRGWLDVDAPLLAALLDDVPRAVARFEPQLADLGDVGEDLRAHLVDDLLDTARFERLEDLHDDGPHVRREGAVAERPLESP